MSERAMNMEDAKAIRHFYNVWGYTQRELAEMWGVDRKTIWRIVNNETYKEKTLPVTFRPKVVDSWGHYTPAETPADEMEYDDHLQVIDYGDWGKQADWFAIKVTVAAVLLLVACLAIWANAWGWI